MVKGTQAQGNGTVATQRNGLLANKLRARPARANLVARPRLIRLLDDGLAASLIVLSASAGFGKTTLLAEWLKDRPHGFCWLSLDPADNDPARFLTYIIVALQQAVPGLAGDLVGQLRSLQPPAPEAVVTTLVNELAAAPGDYILVLDDYHVITSAAVNGALTYLLENLPPNLRLIISARSDPPVPIARLRSRGEVVEIRTDDLRFTPDEAAAFLGQTMGLALSSQQVQTLNERAEGWISGLQMAALSMRGRDDVDGFIRAFAGTHRFIMDFMLEEVLAREPEGVQAFLLQTAVLNRLTGPLCDAVTGTTGGQEMLERLEKRNLFVVPLDDDRRWYRYHHLFADLLQARLRQSGPDAAVRLLSRAAEWCEREGQIADAVGYALAARDYGRAAGLIAWYWLQTMNDGEVETAWGWLNALPEEAVTNSAPLSIACCWMLWLRGQIGAIEPHIVDAERALGEPVLPEHGADGTAQAVLYAELAALRSIVARYRCDFEAAIAQAERALHLLPEGLAPRTNAHLRGMIHMALATAADGAGDLEKAIGAYAETIRWSRLGANATGVAGITNRLAGLLRLLGRLRAADEACREALEYLGEQGMGRLPAAGLLHLAMSQMSVERNELEAAEVHLSRGVELGRWSGRFSAARSIAEAYLRLARQDASGALATVREGEAALSEPKSPLARAELLALEATIRVRQGALAEAARCVEEAVHLAGRDQGQTGEMVALASHRLRLAQTKPDAVAQLTRSLAVAERSGRLGTTIALHILRSLALARRGEWPDAEADLAHALALAEPEGYVRLFVDEGEPMAGLLRRLAARRAQTHAGGACSAHYLGSLLAAFAAPGAGRPSAGPLPPDSGVSPSGAARAGGIAQGLVEPLSERELQVLRLMAEGLTNEQIAAKLIIALGTVKAHIHNISGKLAAQNRAHAVARAKELGLL